VPHFFPFEPQQCTTLAEFLLATASPHPCVSPKFICLVSLRLTRSSKPVSSWRAAMAVNHDLTVAKMPRSFSHHSIFRSSSSLTPGCSCVFLFGLYHSDWVRTPPSSPVQAAVSALHVDEPAPSPPRLL
jgi:hypothetical protein